MVFHKMEPRILYYNFRISWSIFIICTPMEKRMNTPQSDVITYLIAWWRHNYDTSQVTTV